MRVMETSLASLEGGKEFFSEVIGCFVFLHAFPIWLGLGRVY